MIMVTEKPLPTYGYSVLEDSIFVSIIRTYELGQYENVMQSLYSIAKINGKKLLTGKITGEARRRLFVRRGWRVVGQRKHGEDTQYDVEEYNVD